MMNNLTVKQLKDNIRKFKTVTFLITRYSGVFMEDPGVLDPQTVSSDPYFNIQNIKILVFFVN